MRHRERKNLLLVASSLESPPAIALGADAMRSLMLNTSGNSMKVMIIARGRRRYSSK